MLDVFRTILEEHYLGTLIITNLKRYTRIGYAHENTVCKDIVTSCQ